MQPEVQLTCGTWLSTGLWRGEQISLMMLTQYFDMLNNVGARGGNSTVFLNSGPGALSDLGAQMRTALLEASAGGNAQTMKRD